MTSATHTPGTMSARIVRWIMLGAFIGLLFVFTYWYVEQHPAAVLLAGLPLLLILPGCWLVLRTPLGLGGFLALAYFAHGLTELVANPSRQSMALMELLLAAVLLVSCSWLLRWKSINKSKN